MEAVKKLQSSTKLLQKVITPWGLERAWARHGMGCPDPASPPDQACSLSGAAGRGAEKEVEGRWCSPVVLPTHFRTT